MKHQAKDPLTILGMVIAFGLVISSIMIGGGASGFLDLRSFLIVVLGTFAVTAACFSFEEIRGVHWLIMRTIFYRSENPSDTANRCLELAQLSRKNDLLSMQKYMHLAEHNTFAQKGLEMLIDAAPIEQVEGVLSQDLGSMMDRHANGVSLLRKAAEIAPAMGLIGTLIGLVQMLGNLEEPSTIGPAMAVALLTTFYGAIFSYMVLTPLASKLERNSSSEVLTAKLYIRMLQSMARNENPRQLELVLNSMLPPKKRVSID